MNVEQKWGAGIKGLGPTFHLLEIWVEILKNKVAAVISKLAKKMFFLNPHRHVNT